MILNIISPRRSFDVPCVVEVENTFESLHAHVKLEGGVTIEPGDEVLVHGERIEVPYGEKRVYSRQATVSRAGWLERLWTKSTGDIEFMELCEFSFSERARL
ncbi:MAG: hypothetical protein WCH83_16325 [Alphaproteobacteria bacterium]|jgi:uncharacterized Zn finger protein